MTEIKGDLNVGRSEFVARRSDEGLLDLGIISSNYVIDKYSHSWIASDPNGNTFDMVLPDATTLNEGWEITIENYGTGILVIKDSNSNIITKVFLKKAVTVTLTNNSSSAGVWFYKVEGLNLFIKNGILLNTSFSGTPKKATVTFTIPFSTLNYSITISANTARTWSYENKTINGFTLNSNANSLTNLTEISWQAIETGEI